CTGAGGLPARPPRGCLPGRGAGRPPTASSPPERLAGWKPSEPTASKPAAPPRDFTASTSIRGKDQQRGPQLAVSSNPSPFRRKASGRRRGGAGHLADEAEMAQRLGVGASQARLAVGQPVPLAVFPDDGLGAPQGGPRHGGKQVVFDLMVQTP